MSKPVARFRFFRSAWLAAGILLGFSVQAWAYSGDTIQDDIAREFNGATSYTIPLSSPADTRPSATCTETLDAELRDGQLPVGDQCSCPTGATQPVCMSDSSLCQTNLLVIQERMGSGYDCSCPAGDSEPQCTSYYDLCEQALPSYQSSTESCSCPTGATSAVPECTYIAPPPAPPTMPPPPVHEIVTLWGSVYKLHSNGTYTRYGSGGTVEEGTSPIAYSSGNWDIDVSDGKGYYIDQIVTDGMWYTEDYISSIGKWVYVAVYDFATGEAAAIKGYGPSSPQTASFESPDGSVTDFTVVTTTAANLSQAEQDVGD